MSRLLVVNADDLGLTVGVNDGIFDAHDVGILTSASLFAAAPATTDAIRRARSRPSLGVGAHLALVDAEPVLPPARVPSLVGLDGRFRSSWKPFITACLRGRVSLEEVEQELVAQVERLRGQAGIQLTHLDAHKHVHAYPPVFAIVVKIAVRYGIPVVRVPYERGWWAYTGGSETERRQAWLNAALGPWADKNRRLAASFGLHAPRLIGLVHTGVLSKKSLHTLLHRTSPGVTELMVHPGHVDADLRAIPTRLVNSREREVELLCDMRTRALLVGEQIEPVRHDHTPSFKRSIRYVS